VIGQTSDEVRSSEPRGVALVRAMALLWILSVAHAGLARSERVLYLVL
jgi:hypothetical protein